MSIFSSKRQTLAPDIFLPNEQVKPSLRLLVFETIAELIPLQLIYSVWLTGGILGYHWTDEDDIDIQIQLNDPTKVETYSQIIKEYNRSEQLKHFGKHAVTLFVLPQWKFESNDFANLSGGYDLMNDKWVKRSVPPPPQFLEGVELDRPYLDMLKREMSLHMAQYLKDPNWEDALEITQLYQRLDNERKLAYGYGIGNPPKYGPGNVTYKYVTQDFGEQPETIHHLVRKIINEKFKKVQESE